VVQPVDDGGGRITVDGIGPKRGPDLRHGTGCPEVVTDHIADREADPAARKGEGIEPVTAHFLAGPGSQVPRG
jgi:hypothetical protein